MNAALPGTITMSPEAFEALPFRQRRFFFEAVENYIDEHNARLEAGRKSEE